MQRVGGPGKLMAVENIRGRDRVASLAWGRTEVAPTITLMHVTSEHSATYTYMHYMAHHDPVFLQQPGPLVFTIRFHSRCTRHSSM